MVRSLTRMGQYLHMSEYALSFVLAAFATSLPEFFIGITSAWRGVPTLSLGNIVGASFLNVTAVLGVVTLFAGRLESGRTVRKEDIQLTLGMILFPVLLMLDGEVSRLDGFLLLFFFSGYLMYLFDQEHMTPIVNNINNNMGVIQDAPDAVLKAERNFEKFIRTLGVFLAGAFFLAVSAWFVVEQGSVFGHEFGIPLFFIGILAAFGTTLPEAVFGVRSVMLRHGPMVSGNALGSIIVNTSLVLGVVAMISPLAIERPMRAVFGLLLTAAIVILVELVWFLQGSLGRFFGAFLLGAAVAFVAIEYAM